MLKTEKDNGGRRGAKRGQLLAATAMTALAWGGLTDIAAAQAAKTSPAAAGGVLDEVIVTARRREENLQNVPAAITAITGDQLVKQQIRNQVDLTTAVPSLSIEGRVGHQGGTYGIRGLSGTSSGNPSVGTYFAEVPSPVANNGYDASAGQPLYDLANVQVLKGPQGTLFGRTTTAGAVLVTPKPPSLSGYEGDVDILEGTLGREQATVAVNIPIWTDHFAVRAAYHREHLDGYTKVITTGQKLDESNSDGYRFSARFKPTSWFENTTIYDSSRSDEAPAGFILTGYNPNLANFNLPATTTTFNAACTAAVTAGLTPNLAGCVSQRLGILAKIKADLAAEVSRVNGSKGAVRYTNASDAAEIEKLYHRSLINITQVTFPSIGKLDTYFKNIWGYQKTAAVTAVNASGISDNLENLYFGTGDGSAYNQIGNKATVGFGKGNKFYSDEMQFGGNYDSGRLIWVIGYFGQVAPATRDLQNIVITQQTFGGVTTPNLGFVATNPFQYDGSAKQKAIFGQATLDFKGFVDGLHLTVGGRKSNDYNSLTTIGAAINNVTGVISPTGVFTSSSLKTHGTNYTVSLDYRINPNILVYGTTRKGYVPGGLNSPQANTTGLANYALIYGPERIKDYELGVKWDYNINGMRGRIDADYYHMDYSNIQRTFSGITVTGSNVAYIGNVAAAVLKGFEVEAVFIPTESLELALTYSYNDEYYTKWLGADPTNVAPPGTVLDLSNNPFNNAPKSKINFNATYTLPLDERLGPISVNLNVYHQSLEWFSATPGRIIDVYGPSYIGPTTQKAYTLLNARVDWNDVMGHTNLRAAVFVKNLTNTIYATSGLVQLFNLGITTKLYAEPRTAGFELAYKFGG